MGIMIRTSRFGAFTPKYGWTRLGSPGMIGGIYTEHMNSTFGSDRRAEQNLTSSSMVPIVVPIDIVGQTHTIHNWYRSAS